MQNQMLQRNKYYVVYGTFHDCHHMRIRNS